MPCGRSPAACRWCTAAEDRDALRDLVQASFVAGRPVIDAAHALCHAIFTSFEYDPSSTDVSTPLAVVLATRRGVCQDFAHLAVGGLRDARPRRSIRQRLHRNVAAVGQPQLVGADASHAWASCGRRRSAGSTSTRRTTSSPSDRHITVAWGRDYGDVAPVRGVVIGRNAVQRLSVAVAVDVRQPGQRDSDDGRRYAVRFPLVDAGAPASWGRSEAHRRAAHDRLDHEACYRAVRVATPASTAVFVTAVRTTGIYCRPSCPAVTPKRENVEFFPTAAAAQRPRVPGVQALPSRRVARLARMGRPRGRRRPGDAAHRRRRRRPRGRRRAGPAARATATRHLNRLVSGELGAGPLAIARAQRAQTARILIETTDMPITDVAFAAGFGSVRQFNDTVREVFAASPSELRATRRDRAAGDAGQWFVDRRPRRARAVRPRPACSSSSRSRTVPGVEDVGRRRLPPLARPAPWPRRRDRGARRRRRGPAGSTCVSRCGSTTGAICAGGAVASDGCSTSTPIRSPIDARAASPTTRSLRSSPHARAGGCPAASTRSRRRCGRSSASRCRSPARGPSPVASSPRSARRWRRRRGAHPCVPDAGRACRRSTESQLPMPARRRHTLIELAARGRAGRSPLDVGADRDDVRGALLDVPGHRTVDRRLRADARVRRSGRVPADRPRRAARARPDRPGRCDARRALAPVALVRAAPPVGRPRPTASTTPNQKGTS